MTTPMSRRDLEFLLYEWLDVEALTSRERFSAHSRETFDAVLDTCERIARDKYAPHNRTVDTQEPRFDGEKVILPAATQVASRAYDVWSFAAQLTIKDDGEMARMPLSSSLR